jgi:putative sugar O-methyltransferase
MHDSCYLRLTQLLLDQKIHFHIYPHWDYRRDHLGSPHVNFERDFAEFLAIEKRNPYLHLHDSLPIDELGKVLPQYDFGIVSGGCADFGQKLKYYHPAYLETCYSGRISDYLDARLPVLINDEVKFDYWLLKRHGACVDLKGVLRPGFKQHLLELKQDGRQREIMERAAKKLSVDFNSPRLVSFYKAIIAAGTLGQSSEVHDADGSQFSESLTTSSASAKAPEPMFQDGVGTRLMIKLSDAVRWASPRAAKILLPYRAIRIFQVRLHNALQENELNHSLIANLRSQLSDLVQDHLAVTTKLASLLQEHSSACLQASAREQDNAALRARVVDLQQDHSALLTLSASLQTENESFRKANTGNQCQFESLQQEHAVLRSQCNELQQNNDVLQTLVRNLKDEVGALTQQVHVLSNEKFILQQEAQWGKLPINEIAGVLNWPEVLNDVERANGFTDLIRILGLFSGGANRPDSPSACWNLLATKNYDQLLTSGYNNFKRTVGTNYFNFLVQKGDPQIQAVESLLSVETIARCRSAALSIPEDRLLPCPDQFSYNYFVLLLWEYVKTLDVARHIDKLGEPEEGNPILVRSGERSVSQDLANSLIEYYAISESVSFAQIGTVLEIGGGYGRNAYVILALNPGIRVTMVDIPPALYLAQRYLSSVFKGRRVFKARNFSNYDEVKDELEAASIVFLMPHQLAFMPKGIFDLSMNISSFGEMSNEQIQWYFPQIGRVTGQYFYMKQWRTSSNVFDGTVLQESDYPYPKNWRQIYSRPGRVQTEFFEALYQVTKT